MKTGKHQVTFQGQVYRSLKEFAESQNLTYSQVVAYHRRGMSPDEIFAACQFTASSKTKAVPKKTTKQEPVVYDGVAYPSLYKAAEVLGISPGQLYYLRNKKGLSPEEAIEYSIRHLARPGTGDSPNAKPCTVEGVTYPSREAALNAYHLTRITVYSRMERDGITFEEALIQGRDKSVYRTPTPSLFPKLHLTPMRGELSQPLLEDLQRSLEHYRYKVQLMRDREKGIQALSVNGHSYVYYNQQARGLEIISKLPIEVDKDTLWDLNAEYVAVKLFSDRETGEIYLSSFQSAKEKGSDIKALLNTWFSYICIRDMLLRKFGTTSP